MATYMYDRLPDERELVNRLRAHDRVFVRSRGIRLQQIEREVERLGFGEQSMVSAVRSKKGEGFKIAPAHGTFH